MKRSAQGEDFEISDVKVLEARRKTNKESVSAFIAKLTASIIAVFVLGAAGVGWHEDDYSNLNTIWSVSGPFAGALFAYYFGERTTWT